MIKHEQRACIKMKHINNKTEVGNEQIRVTKNS